MIFITNPCAFGLRQWPFDYQRDDRFDDAEAYCLDATRRIPAGSVEGLEAQYHPTTARIFSGSVSYTTRD